MATILCAFLDDFAAQPDVGGVKRRARELLGLRSGDAVLDLGCGTGDDVAGFAVQVGASGLAVAVDRNQTIAARAGRRHRRSRARIAVGNGHRLPFRDGCFDAVYCERVLIHDRRPATLIAELARTCRPGARLVTVEPDWGALRLDHSDQATTGAIARFAASHGLASPAAAREVVGLFDRCGLTEARAERHDVALPFAIADQTVGFEMTVLDAHHAGAIGDHAFAWLAELERRHTDGTFACTLPMVITTARTPA